MSDTPYFACGGGYIVPLDANDAPIDLEGLFTEYLVSVEEKIEGEMKSLKNGTGGLIDATKVDDVYMYTLTFRVPVPEILALFGGHTLTVDAITGEKTLARSGKDRGGFLAVTGITGSNGSRGGASKVLPKVRAVSTIPVSLNPEDYSSEFTVDVQAYPDVDGVSVYEKTHVVALTRADFV